MDKCASCGVACDPEDDFCYGCNNIICVGCANRQTQKNVSPTNEHVLEDHMPDFKPLNPPFDIHEAPNP